MSCPAMVWVYQYNHDIFADGVGENGVVVASDCFALRTEVTVR